MYNSYEFLCVGKAAKLFQQISGSTSILIIIMIAIVLIAIGAFLLMRAAGRQVDALRLIGSKLDAVAAAVGAVSLRREDADQAAESEEEPAVTTEKTTPNEEEFFAYPAGTGRVPYNIGKSGKVYTKAELEALIRE